MNQKVLRETITFLKQRAEEYLGKILDKNIKWEDKESDYIKLLEDLVILGRLLETEVVVKTDIVW